MSRWLMTTADPVTKELQQDLKQVAGAWIDELAVEQVSIR